MPLTMPPMQSEQLANLTPHEAKLLFDIISQWRMGKNGDMCATWTVMKNRGWRSQETLNNAIKGLMEKGLVIRTRQGSLNKCSLYGLGWIAIDECGGKLDIAPTRGPVTKDWPKFMANKN